MKKIMKLLQVLNLGQNTIGISHEERIIMNRMIYAPVYETLNFM